MWNQKAERIKSSNLIFILVMLITRLKCLLEVNFYTKNVEKMSFQFLYSLLLNQKIMQTAPSFSLWGVRKSLNSRENRS